MRTLTSTEAQMLQMRKHAGLATAGPVDEAAAPPKDPFEVLTDLLKAVADGGGKKLLADLAKQSADARTLRDLAAKDRAAVDEHAQDEARRIAAERDAIGAERKAHDGFVASERAAIDMEHKAATAAREVAEKLKTDAAALKAELQKRLRAVEAAVNG